MNCGCLAGLFGPSFFARLWSTKTRKQSMAPGPRRESQGSIDAPYANPHQLSMNETGNGRPTSPVNQEWLQKENGAAQVDSQHAGIDRERLSTDSQPPNIDRDQSARTNGQGHGIQSLDLSLEMSENLQLEPPDDGQQTLLTEKQEQDMAQPAPPNVVPGRLPRKNITGSRVTLAREDIQPSSVDQERVPSETEDAQEHNALSEERFPPGGAQDVQSSHHVQPLDMKEKVPRKKNREAASEEELEVQHDVKSPEASNGQSSNSRQGRLPRKKGNGGQN